MPKIFTYANVASTLAVVLALSGSAYAAATITGRDVKNNSLTGTDVATGSLQVSDLKADLLPGASAAITVGGTIPQGVGSAYAFDTEVYDTGSMFVVGDDHLTITRPGQYLVSLGTTFELGGAAQRQVRILLNGLVVLVDSSTATTSRTSLMLTHTFRLAAGDEVGLGTFNSGADSAISNFSGETADAWLSAQMVSP